MNAGVSIIKPAIRPVTEPMKPLTLRAPLEKESAAKIIIHNITYRPTFPPNIELN